MATFIVIFNALLFSVALILIGLEFYLILESLFSNKGGLPKYDKPPLPPPRQKKIK